MASGLKTRISDVTVSTYHKMSTESHLVKLRTVFMPNGVTKEMTTFK
jgi:hypothetical protein